jgi:hypothetical protein
MTPYSLLDLAPVVEGGTVAQSLANAADLPAMQRRWAIAAIGAPSITA